MPNAVRKDKPLYGVQKPRIDVYPAAKTSAGTDCVELCAEFGLILDPWEADVLEGSLGEQASGRWAAFEVGLCAARQNGKGSIIEARIMGGLFLFGDELITYSAHEFRTAKITMKRVERLLRQSGQAYKPNRSHGEESLVLPPSKVFPYERTVQFQTRTMSGGRGLTGDCVFLDEAMILKVDAVQALMPTLSARPHPQLWYVGSAVDQKVHPHGEVFTALRRRALASQKSGNVGRLCYKEWSCDEDDVDLSDAPDAVTAKPAGPKFRKLIAQANPGLGFRITEEYICDEYEGFKDLNLGGWKAERLGIGDWPILDTAKNKINMERWLSDDICVPMAPAPKRVVLVVAVAQDRSFTSIAVAGAYPPDHDRTIVLNHSVKGTAKAAKKIEELMKAKSIDEVWLAGDMAKVIKPSLVKAGIEFEWMNRNEMGAACGSFLSAVNDDGDIVHVGQPELTLACRNARTRMMGESEVWDRRDPMLDDSPLVAASGAYYRWGLQNTGLPAIW